VFGTGEGTKIQVKNSRWTNKPKSLLCNVVPGRVSLRAGEQELAGEGAAFENETVLSQCSHNLSLLTATSYLARSGPSTT
jgi:hypothetical protein